MATADRPPDHIDLGDVVLRAPRLDDAEALLAATTVDLDHLGPWMAWATPEQNTLDQRRAFIQEDLQRPEGDRSATYLVVDPADGTVLGSTGLHDRVGPDGLEVGYWLASRVTGRGIMTRAGAALVEVALARPGVTRVEVRCDEANHRSAAIPRRLGFTLARTMDSEVTAPAETGRQQIWVLAADGP